MVRIIKSTDSKEKINKVLKKNTSPKNKTDWNKYFGTVNWDIDPVEYQKKIREDRI